MNADTGAQDIVRNHVRIRGRVQGVFFRDFTMREALHHDVKGWVRNMPDGSVEAVFEGTRSDVEAIVHSCKIGPPHALVTDIKLTDELPQGEQRFKVC